MADSLTLQIGVDTTALTAKLAQAQADVRAYAAEVRKLADQLRQTGGDATLQQQLERTAAQLANAQAAAAGFRSELRGGLKQEIGGASETLAGLGGTVKELAGILGVGFSAGAIIEGIKSVAELGERTENLAAAVGTAPEHFARLAGALQLVGGDADAAARAAQVLERNMQAALANPKSPQALNAAALGFGPEEIKKGLEDVVAFIEGPYADAYKKYVIDSANPGTGIAEFRVLAGRSESELAPAVKGGSANVKELEDRAEKLGLAPSKEQIKALAETAGAINELKGAFTGLEVTIATEFKDSIIAATNALRDLAGEPKKVLDYSNTIGGAGIGAAGGGLVAGLPGAVVGGVYGGVRGVSGMAQDAGAVARTVERIKAHPLETALLPRWLQSAPETAAAPPQQWSFEEFAGAAPAPAPAPAASGKNITPAPIPVTKIAEDLEKQLRLLDDELKLKQANYRLDTEHAKDRGDQGEIERIQERQQALEKEILTRKNLAIAKAENDSHGLVTGDTNANQVALINLEIAAEEQRRKAAEAATTTAVSGMEGQRKLLDEAAGADLSAVERRQRLGEITVDAAAKAEQEIVAEHARAADAILAREQELAASDIKLWQEIANKRAELEQQTQDKLAAIQDKAAAEDKARGEKVDSEIAGQLASAIMGKESIGQALQKIVQGEEKKVLEGAIKQVLDASGVGESIDKAEQGLLGSLPGAKKTTTTGPDHLTAALAKTTPEVARLGDAAREAAAKLSGGVEPSAAGSPAPASSPSAGAGGASTGTHGSAAENVANNNFGNLRAVGGGWQSFATPEAGALAIGNQLDRYASGATTGTPVTTLEGMISTWAPPSENNTAALVAAASARTGIAPGATVDLSNPEVRRAITRAIVLQENPGAAPQAMAAYDGGGATAAAGAPLLPEVPHYPALAEGGSVEATGLATVHAGEDVVPAGFWGQIGADISDFIANPLEHAKQQLSSTFAPLPPSGVTPQGASITGEAPTPLPVDIQAVAGGTMSTTTSGAVPVSSPSDQAAGPDLVSGLTGNSSAIAAQTASTEALKVSTDELKASIGQMPAAKPAGTAGGGAAGSQTATAAAAAATGDNATGGGGLGGLLGLAGLLGIGALLSRPRTAGSPSVYTPSTVFTSHGITSQTSGSATPSLVQANNTGLGKGWEVPAAIAGAALFLPQLLGGLFGGGGSSSGSGGSSGGGLLGGIGKLLGLGGSGQQGDTASATQHKKAVDADTQALQQHTQTASGGGSASGGAAAPGAAAASGAPTPVDIKAIGGGTVSSSQGLPVVPAGGTAAPAADTALAKDIAAAGTDPAKRRALALGSASGVPVSAPGAPPYRTGSTLGGGTYANQSPSIFGGGGTGGGWEVSSPGAGAKGVMFYGNGGQNAGGLASEGYVQTAGSGSVKTLIDAPDLSDPATWAGSGITGDQDSSSIAAEKAGWNRYYNSVGSGGVTDSLGGFSSYAGGTGGTPPGTILVGEEGPELLGRSIPGFAGGTLDEQLVASAQASEAANAKRQTMWAVLLALFPLLLKMLGGGGGQKANAAKGSGTAVAGGTGAGSGAGGAATATGSPWLSTNPLSAGYEWADDQTAAKMLAGTMEAQPGDNFVSPNNAGAVVTPTNVFVPGTNLPVSETAGQLAGTSSWDLGGGDAGVAGFAGGTGGTPPGTILVGERGPELITQPGGLSVLTAPQTRQALAGDVPGFAEGITSEVPGSITPALVAANPQAQLPWWLALLPLLTKMLGGGGSGGGLFGGLGSLFGGSAGGSGSAAGGGAGSGLSGGGAAGGGGLLSGFQQLGGAIGKVIPGFGQLTSAVTSVIGGFSSLAGSIGKAIFGGGGAAGGGGLFSFLGLAGGTGSTPAGPILVGERGPEIITQPGGLQVIPAGSTKSLLSDFGGFDMPAGFAGRAAAFPGFAEGTGGWTIPAAPAPAATSPNFGGAALDRAGGGGTSTGTVAGHAAGGSPISVNITSFDGHDVRRVLTSQAGRAAIAEAFARERRGNSRHSLSDG